MTNQFDAIVIGGGPAGILAAGQAARAGRRTLLLERNDVLGRKLRIAGGGRCNVTNRLPLRDFLRAFGRDGEFLRSAIAAFGPNAFERFLNDLGIKLYAESDRLFVAGGGQILVDRLQQWLRDSGVTLRFGVRVTGVESLGHDGFAIATDAGQFHADRKIVITTGGKSYPATGSSGDGFALAAQLGHTITPLVPAMGPVRLRENIFSGLAGISVPNVRIEVLADGKRAGKFAGDLMITHQGLSGPAVLDASLEIARQRQKQKNVELILDFAAADEPDDLAVLDQLPQRLRDHFITTAGIKTVGKNLQISRPQRHALNQLLRNLHLPVADAGDWDQAMVTVGGVSLREIDPKTMQSKITPGLHFAGEILDLAASCGGFNIQAAFATGCLAGNH